MNDDEYTFTFDSTGETGTIDVYSEPVSTITLSGMNDTTVTIDPGLYTIDDTIDLSSITISAIPFTDTMPDLDRVLSMCEEYPALNKSFETFKTIYKMCEQDYKGKLKERGLDDDIPF